MVQSHTTYIEQGFGIGSSKFYSPEPAESDFFGSAVALDEAVAIVGARQGHASGDGTLYSFDVFCCPPDCNHDGLLNINDFICFQTEWRKRSAYGDYNDDGLWNINDFIAFQADWRGGCL